jgi:hypothetical protein
MSSEKLSPLSQGDIITQSWINPIASLGVGLVINPGHIHPANFNNQVLRDVVILWFYYTKDANVRFETELKTDNCFIRSLYTILLHEQ